MQQPPSDLVTAFGLTDLRFVAAPGRAAIWRCLWQGKEVALKVYRDRDMGNEAAGVAMMAGRAGRGTVQIYAQGAGAFVMEWLPGPALGDLTRAGRDGEAMEIFPSVVKALQDAPQPAAPGTPHVADWFEDLFALRRGQGCPDGLWQSVQAAQALTRGLLAGNAPDILLHGDLHYDNILGSDRGWLAFDAKGVRGPLAYDLANAFRNPKGAEDLISDPSRARRCARVWSKALGLDPNHLLQWAAAKSALSISWRARGVLEDDWEAGNLAMFLGLAEARQI